ncbi:MAG: hypothetical protein JST22_12045 [Bacteroidetes bacterium]|nr:hypothetical protein [Bacteroidota bacterium]
MRHATRLLCSTLPALFILLLSQITGYAQEGSSWEVIEEKTHWTPEEVRRAHLEALKGGSPEAQGNESVTTGESVVSAEAVPESEVHAAINPLDSNNILVSPIRLNLADGLLCPVYYTKDFGVTWHKSVFRTIPRGLDILNNGGGDPVLAFDADGTGYLVWISLFQPPTSSDSTYFGLYWARSTDGGVTWAQTDTDDVGIARYSRSTRNPEVFDKEWIAVDRTSGARRNNVYVSFVQLGGSNGGGRIVVRRLAAGGSSFSHTSVPVSDSTFERVQFGSIEVDPFGKVHVMFFGSPSNAQYALWHSVSSNGGLSFSTPQKIADVHFPGFSTGTFYTLPGISSNRLYPCPQFTIDNSSSPTRGNIYAVWTADGELSNLNRGLNIYFSRSADNGASWSTPIVVNDDRDRTNTRHHHYPSITVSQQGVVAVSWYDRRGDSASRITNYMMAYSFDGGETFTKNFVITAKPTNFSTVGNRNSQFGIGEYTQVVAAGGYAIPVWTDGRGNTGDLNIYSAIVPIQPDVSGVERLSAVTEKLSMAEPVVSGNEARFGITLTEGAHVRLEVFNTSGQIVATPIDDRLEAGTRSVSVNLGPLPSGRYFCHLASTLGNATRSFVIAR